MLIAGFSDDRARYNVSQPCYCISDDAVNNTFTQQKFS